METRKVKSRKFLGAVPARTKFEKAHLKAYLKGKKTFNHGFTSLNGKSFPIVRKVQQQLIFE
jgi:hypothetical protein